MQLTVDVFLYLIIYSFLGWCCETVYCSVGRGYFVNRGFLNGPFCPIYGFGAVLVLLVLSPLNGSVLGIFLGGVLLTSTLEYITSWGLEKMFGTSWWDYSEKPYNINGRVCLLNSTLFGLLCLFLFFDLHPFIKEALKPFTLDFKLGFLTAFYLYFVADLIVTIKSVLGINSRLEIIGKIKQQLIEEYKDLNIKNNLEQTIKELKEKNYSSDLASKLVENKRFSIFQTRILKAFPGMTSNKHKEILNEIKLKYKNKRAR